jgi:hypothetical protein
MKFARRSLLGAVLLTEALSAMSATAGDVSDPYPSSGFRVAPDRRRQFRTTLQPAATDKRYDGQAAGAGMVCRHAYGGRFDGHSPGRRRRRLPEGRARQGLGERRAHGQTSVELRCTHKIPGECVTSWGARLSSGLALWQDKGQSSQGDGRLPPDCPRSENRRPVMGSPFLRSDELQNHHRRAPRGRNCRRSKPTSSTRLGKTIGRSKPPIVTNRSQWGGCAEFTG